MGRKLGRCALWEGNLGPHLTQCGLGRGLPPYQVASGSIQPFDKNRHGHKLAAVPLWVREAGSPFNTIWGRPRPTCVPSFILIHPAVWHNRHRPRIVRTQAKQVLLCPFPWRAGSPSNTMCLGPRPTSMPCFTSIRPTVWPQYNNVTDKTGQTGQRSESTGRTVLQTVAKN